jgi:1,4-alpha-glucan branching enzyme
MAIKKQVLKEKNRCKVKFLLPKEVAVTAKTVHLVGDFNNWDTFDTPMRKLKDGSYHVTLELEKGKEYQFRYLLDHFRWENEVEADKHVPSGIGNSLNSVVSI